MELEVWHNCQTSNTTWNTLGRTLMVYDTRQSLYISSFTSSAFDVGDSHLFFTANVTKHKLDRSSGYKDTILGIDDFTPFRS